MSQFSLDPVYAALSQTIFAAAQKLEQVHDALVPTCDEFFLSHALDRHRSWKPQAYLFTALPELKRQL